jgi:hypothetical protein
VGVTACCSLYAWRTGVCAAAAIKRRKISIRVEWHALSFFSHTLPNRLAIPPECARRKCVLGAGCSPCRAQAAPSALQRICLLWLECVIASAPIDSTVCKLLLPFKFSEEKRISKQRRMLFFASQTAHSPRCQISCLFALLCFIISCLVVTC